MQKSIIWFCALENWLSTDNLWDLITHYTLQTLALLGKVASKAVLQMQ